MLPSGHSGLLLCLAFSNLGVGVQKYLILNIQYIYDVKILWGRSNQGVGSI